MVLIDYSLYLVTDRELLAGRSLIDEVGKAVRGGVTMVQLREKHAGSREFYQLALALKNELNQSGIPLIINDRLDIALAAGADGLHIGQDDLPLEIAIDLMPSGSIIGVSVSTPAEAREACSRGATYLGAGPVFFTPTKEDASSPIGLAGLRAIKQLSHIPLVAIGGIHAENLADIRKTGADGAAVVSALMGKADIEASAQRMMRIWQAS